MAVIEIPKEVDRFVLYFDTPRKQINAVALATALVGLADAVREANTLVNPGYTVEVVVEALESGSFQAVISTVYNKGKDLFGSEPVRNIVYGIVSAYIFQQALAPDTKPVIIVQNNQVVIESGNDRVIVPKEVFEAKERLERSERFRGSVNNIIAGANADKTVAGVGVKTDNAPRRPEIYVPRERFIVFDGRREDEEDSREIIEYANLEISRAILARGSRKWEFFWRGIKVSAPLLDERFYDRFFAHEITIAPGDALRVALRITQKRHPDTGIFINERYEVVEVFEHIPRMQQSPLQ